jgi:cytochrome c-type biogenesis protein CcmE
MLCAPKHFSGIRSDRLPHFEQNLGFDLFQRNFAPVAKISRMKKMHIILLVVIAAVIAGLLTWMKDLSTYDTVASARRKDGRFVHLIARLDKSEPVVYDPVKDPNYLSFHALDSLGGRTQVVYRNAKPVDLERSERVVMKGRMRGEVFECSEIVLKCPSKYKEDPGVQMRQYEGEKKDSAAVSAGS